MQRLFLFLLTVCAMYAQTGTEVNISQGPPWTPYTRLLFRDGSGNNEYLCIANSIQPTFTWPSSSTLTSIVDSANTATATTTAAHGLLPGNVVVIGGVATDTDLNGTYIIQAVPTSTTFTVTTANVTDATYNFSNNPLMTLSTTAPRTSATIWRIMRMYYTGTALDRSAMAVTNPASCDLRASYGYN
jgi:hypothetical protein